jgi:hypothetical protein
MRLGTLIAILGLILSALGGLWYWQIMQVAAALAWTSGSNNLNRNAWFAVALFFLGLAVFIVCVVVNFVVKDQDE